MSDEQVIERADVIIVGAGISGLYAAYRIQQKAPQLNVLVLEAKGNFMIIVVAPLVDLLKIELEVEHSRLICKHLELRNKRIDLILAVNG
jgi:choline dehydrogenase-like flavoprotein